MSTELAIVLKDLWVGVGNLQEGAGIVTYLRLVRELVGSDEARRNRLAAFEEAASHRLEESLDRLGRTPEEKDRVRRRLAEEEMQRVLLNVMLEASREAIQERWRMLTYALSGVAASNLTMGAAARTERKIRELDPDDVVEFGRIAKPLEKDGVASTAAHAAWEASPSRDMLVAAGCLRVEIKPGMGVTRRDVAVTPQGADVLQVLGDYIVVRAAEAAKGAG